MALGGSGVTNNEIIDRKLAIVEREIREWESSLRTAEVNLRKQKELRWVLLGELETEVDELDT